MNLTACSAFLGAPSAQTLISASEPHESSSSTISGNLIRKEGSSGHAWVMRL
jgi:hypothetical protein